MFGTFRVFLALWVVLLHIGGVPKVGAYAVFGFYILSGYLMTMITQKTYGYTLEGVCAYLWNRMLRIFPMYWTSILMSIILLAILGQEAVIEYREKLYWPVTLADWGRNIFAFFPARESPSLTPPAWALTVELIFYVLIGLGIARNVWSSLLWFTLSLAYHCKGIFIEMTWDERYFSVLAASLPFAAGSLVFHCKRFLEGRVGARTALVAVIAMCLNWGVGYVFQTLETYSFYANFLLCVVIVSGLSLVKAKSTYLKKLDAAVGELSYPIYLMHYQFALIVVAIASLCDVNLERPSIGLLLASTPWIVLGSWLAAKIVDGRVESLRARVREKASNSVKRIHA